MNNAQKAGAGVAAVFAAAAIATPWIVEHEGWRTTPYADPVGIPTVCAGATKGVVKGKTYTDRECMDLLARDVVTHGMEIDRCITRPISAYERAAYTSFAYNIGTARFCGSTLVKKLNAGDRKGACAELSKWVFACGKQFPGLVKRRTEERRYCEQGLS